jgi:hypothetical protein
VLWNDVVQTYALGPCNEPSAGMGDVVRNACGIVDEIEDYGNKMGLPAISAANDSGMTLSSAELTHEAGQTVRSVVQIGDPVTEKAVMVEMIIACEGSNASPSTTVAQGAFPPPLDSDEFNFVGEKPRKAQSYLFTGSCVPGGNRRGSLTAMAPKAGLGCDRGVLILIRLLGSRRPRSRPAVVGCGEVQWLR